MGRYEEISKIIKDLDHKYHFDTDKEQKDDALIKHIEEEYNKEQNNDNSK